MLLYIHTKGLLTVTMLLKIQGLLVLSVHNMMTSFKNDLIRYLLLVVTGGPSTSD